MVQQTDESLMRAVGRGDGAAFAALVRRHHAALRGYLLRLAQDPHLADDLVQETFIRVYTRAGTFQAEGRFRPWLYRIATNLFIDHVRRCREAPLTVPADFPPGEDGPAAGAWRAASAAALDTRPEAHVLLQEQRQQVQQALSRLPVEQRAILLLRFDRELTLPEIAATLQLPLGTVKSRLFRALRRFAQLLQEQENLHREGEVDRARAAQP